MPIEEELKQLIVSRYRSLRQFSNEVNLPYTTITGMLERGLGNAGIHKVIKICNELGIDIDALADGYIKEKTVSDIPITLSEQAHIKKYRSLAENDKETVDILVDRLSIREIDTQYLNFEPPKVIDLYPHLASAGTGQYLFDDIPIAKIEVPFECEADFAIGVNGDSMEPTFHDGDDLLIKKQKNINVGEIGIFIINGESFVKEYQKDRLVSHNKKYKDIMFSENMNIICVGKVVGTN